MKPLDPKKIEKQLETLELQMPLLLGNEAVNLDRQVATDLNPWLRGNPHATGPSSRRDYDLMKGSITGNALWDWLIQQIPVVVVLRVVLYNLFRLYKDEKKENRANLEKSITTNKDLIALLKQVTENSLTNLQKSDKIIEQLNEIGRLLDRIKSK